MRLLSKEIFGIKNHKGSISCVGIIMMGRMAINKKKLAKSHTNMSKSINKTPKYIKKVKFTTRKMTIKNQLNQ